MARGEEPRKPKLFWPEDIKEKYKKVTGVKMPFRGKGALSRLESEVEDHNKEIDFQRKKVKETKSKLADKSLSEKDKESIRSIELDYYSDELEGHKAQVKAIESLAQRIRDHLGD